MAQQMDIGQLLAFIKQPAPQAQAINPASLLPPGAGQPPAGLANIFAQEQAAKRKTAADKAALDLQTQQQADAREGIAAYLAPLQAQMSPEAWNLAQANVQMLENPASFDTGMTGIQKLMEDRSDLRKALAQDTGKVSTSKRLARELGYEDGSIEQQQFIRDHAMKSGITIDQGEKYVSVSDLSKMMTADGQPLPPGITWDEARDMGAVLRNKESEGAAGKLTMMQTAQNLFGTIDQLMFDETGAPNTDVIRNAFLIGLDPSPGEMISKMGISLFGGEEEADKAGKVYQAFEQGFQAMTRTETGAAMPAEEIENTKRRFRPGPLDSDAEVMQKYNAYKFFINNAVNLMRPADGKPKAYGDDVGALTQDINRIADQALIQAGVSMREKIGEDGRGEDDQYEYLVEPVPPGFAPAE